MCFKSSAPKAPAVQPAPAKDDVRPKVIDERRRVSEQQGAMGSIFTSVLGDSGYGKNAVKPAAAVLGV
jgi:hypothetical protein